MGNDIFSVFVEKKKSMILEYASIFFKYTVNDKSKITKTLSNIIDVYVEKFYFTRTNDYTYLNNYYDLEKSKDILLKDTILSTLYFYRDNNLEGKIEKDKATIVLISNVLYLGISLSNSCFKNYTADASMLLEQFFNKYKSKIRIKIENTEKEFHQELNIALKRDLNSVKKAFKCFENINYTIELKKILDSNQNYFVDLKYEIKSLAKYNKKDIDNVINKNLKAELALITLEQTSLKVAYNYLSGLIEHKYFVKVPIEMFEKQKYIKLVNDIFKAEQLKENIVFVFSFDDVIDSKKILTSIKESNYLTAINNVGTLKINRNTFDNFDYAFVNSQFLELYDGYQEIWYAKGIKFIIG